MAAAAIALVMAGCGTDKEQESEIKTVMTVSVQNENSDLEKHYSGTVKEAARVSVAFKTAGQLSRILVKEGSHVGEGQLIATLDDSDYQLGVKAAESQHRQLSGEVERLRKLREANALSGNDFDKALSGLEQVEVNLQVYQNKVKYTKLYSPASGYVEKVNFERSEMVDAGTPVITLIADGCKEVDVSLPLSTYQQREQIAKCSASIAGREYPLRLLSIVPKADNTQLYRATFAITGAGAEVSSGMNADVSLTLLTKGAESPMSLPIHAVFQHEGKNCVWVVGNDSTVKRTEIQTGSVTSEGRISIIGGLNGGERVVKAGVTHLQEGDKVKEAENESETNVGGLI